MKVIPLAADSMGCRSMATLVETPDFSVVIDPSASVGAYRYGLKPHALELWHLKKLKDRIRLFCRKTDLIVITCFHHDHYAFDEPDLYRGKILLMKNPNQHIHAEHRNRAFEFLKTIKGIPAEVHYMDNRNYTLGKTTLTFSPPVAHGGTDKTHHVIQCVIKDDQSSFLFTSDVQGPSDAAVPFILDQNPDFIYIDGPNTYLHEKGAGADILPRSIDTIIQILNKTKMKEIILDHHLIRDLNWREQIKGLFEYAKRQSVSIQTAASFRGENENPLEARREQLYNNDDVP